MKVTMTISIACCLLLTCTPAIAQEAASSPVPELPLATPAVPGILSAIPADAYGFAATNNLQASYDNIVLFVQALGLPMPDENKLLAIQENIGQVDLNGPAAAILLDPQKFSPPLALLFSAADAQAVFEAHQAKAQDSDEALPAGVVKGPDGYLAVKHGFVVYAPQADQVAAVLAGQTPLQIMPAAAQAFDKGQIVLAGDLQQAAPFLIQKLDEAKMAQAQMIAQMGPAAQMPQMAMAVDMFAWEVDMAKALIQQADKLAVALDINAEQALLTKRVLFKADSAAAAFMNAQMGQKLPSYSALPAGPFFMAGAVNVVPENNQALANTILDSLMNLPSFKEKFSAEQIQQLTTDLTGSNAVVSSSAFTFNLVNPMAGTGMFNMVQRYDVSDSALYKELSKKECSASAMLAEAFGGPAMAFVYTTAAENYSDVDIDTIKMEITPPEPPAEDDPMAQQKQMIMAQQMQMMPMMFGPDMTFRLAAPNDKQILLVMGGAGRMERAINVAQGNGSVLADDPRIAQAVAKLPSDRFAEAHLDLGQVVPMIGMFAAMAGGPPPTAPAQAPVTPPISFSATAENNALRVDLVVPSESIGTLVQSFMAMRMQMMQQRGGPGGPAEPSEDFE